MQNVVLLVLDAFRSDALDHAPTLSSLANNNICFDRAIAPGRWSLPSHASLFSGLPPHEHGLCTPDDKFESVPLVEQFDDAGYSTYAISGNPFCSGWYRFDEPFDEFTYSLDLQHHDGLDVHELTRSLPPVETRADVIRRYGTILRRAIAHEKPCTSLYNIGVSGFTKLSNAVDVFDRIPHPLFAPSNVYMYSPERNTRAILDAFEQGEDADEPFFVFSNYMDTHRPYYPSKPYQQEFDATRSFAEIRRLNEEVAHSQRFIEQVTAGTLDEDDVETVRSLYAGTAAEVDAHVERLLADLDSRGLLEETLLVITADHGEDLGETGPRGERRMGHFESVSDRLLTVPLIVANPSLEARAVRETVSALLVFDLLTDGLPDTTSAVVETFLRCGPIVAECPATRGRWRGEYPGVPDYVAERQTREHTVVGYEGGFKLALDSTGSEWAWQSGELVDPAMVPDNLQAECAQRLEALSERHPPGDDGARSEVRDQLAGQLEDLGYL